MQNLYEIRQESWYPWLLRGILAIGFLILVARLFELQIVRGDYFRALAESNRVRRIPIAAPRGQILASDGSILVGNQEVPKEIVFSTETGYKKIETESRDNPEGDYIIEWQRTYSLGAAFGHVSGYLGEADEEEVGKVRGDCPEKGTRRVGTFVGRTGLEEYYECKLAGIDGEELVEVDAGGHEVRTLGRRNSQKGTDIQTSVEADLQAKLPEFIGVKKGVIIISDTKGRIKALYSSPGYDPNIFLKKDNTSEVQKVLSSSELPMFNRAIGGAFHPGSVYKPLISLAALSEKVIDRDFHYTDEGVLTVRTLYGDYNYANWYFTQYGGREGSIDVTRALARSTDTFYYKVGEMMGIEKIKEWSEKFGLNKKTGIDLPGEIIGLVPSPEWKERVKNEKWFLGNTYHVSIGQGDLAVTPIALHSSILPLTNEGQLCNPKFVGDPSCKELGVEKTDIDTVLSGMKKACESGGTAYPFFGFEPGAACKTGTAETDDGDDSTHAWFVAMAPVENPEIVATILIEKGGEGSKEAAPIAREIFDYWFYTRIGKEAPGRVVPETADSE